jgi:hypothetical protein
VGCSIKVMIAATMDDLFDYCNVGVWDSGVMTIVH